MAGRALGAALGILACGATAEAGPIVIDGRFDDWADVPVACADARDDGGRGVDLGALKVTSDARRVYLFFEVGEERNLQNDNGIKLLVDIDASSQTGRASAGIGADLEWSFGARKGVAHVGGSAVDLVQADLGLRQGPTVTSTTFEVSLLRRVTLGNACLSMGPSVAVAILDAGREDGDAVPDEAGGVTVCLSDAPPPPAAPLDLARSDPSHVRVMTWNVLFDGLFKRPGPFGRVLRAVAPDVICFQEIWRHTAEETALAVAEALPGVWHAAQADETVVVSRYPIADSAALHEQQGNVWALVDLPDDRYARDLSVVSAHPPCCGDNRGRQREFDAIAAFLRDARTRRRGTTAGAAAAPRLPAGTPLVIAGDMNLVGHARQLETLLGGRIEDEETFGPSATLDWDGTSLTDPMPLHTTGQDAYTWRDDEGSFAPGRLDYTIYSDSAAGRGRSFVLSTGELTDEELTAAGLTRADTAEASDHLPVVLDLAVEPAR